MGVYPMNLLFRLMVSRSGAFWGSRSVGIGLGGVSYYDNSFAFADLAKHGNIVQSNFAAYTAFDSLRNATTDFLMTITSARLKNGVYKLEFTGKCDNLTAGGNAITLTNKVYSVGTNTTTADVTLTNENESSNRWISFNGTHSTDVGYALPKKPTVFAGSVT